MPVSADDLKAFRQSLEQRLAALRDLRRSAADSRKPVELDQTSVGRLSRVDAMQRRAMALEVERRRADEIRRIEGALRRMNTNAFGQCTICDEEIGPKRLAVDPTIATCIKCASEKAR